MELSLARAKHSSKERFDHLSFGTVLKTAFLLIRKINTKTAVLVIRKLNSKTAVSVMSFLKTAVLVTSFCSENSTPKLQFR